jgi:hypothetical protein
LHEDGLDGLGLIKESLGTDFEAANILGVDVVFLEERGDGGQGERVDICTENTSIFPSI